MKIIVSPTKQMKFKDDFHIPYTTPAFLKESEVLREKLSALDFDTLKKTMKVSDKMAGKVYDLFHTGHPARGCALLSYSGIAFQYMAPGVFTDREIEYVENHLRILSGLYGVLRPLDQIEGYRLEMQTKLPFSPFSLYDFWKDALAQALDDEIILNLASEEYAKCIRPYKPLIDVRFLDVDGKEKGVYVKMARGEMVRYMAENNIERVEDIRHFDRQNFAFCPERSNSRLYVFQKTK
ncbi:peroxide stress protein YaaA [uncultured Dubosiella sp.]|uniref:peroxide stress protein YaaA n=1 Tax=uncultured Dubosiella sp. TaxID=1937011 RepID=UPI0025925A50|nr:peroxide stress protein YaaA [uncultured Dubosiella sp.]